MKTFSKPDLNEHTMLLNEYDGNTQFEMYKHRIDCSQYDER